MVTYCLWLTIYDLLFIEQYLQVVLKSRIKEQPTTSSAAYVPRKREGSILKQYEQLALGMSPRTFRPGAGEGEDGGSKFFLGGGGVTFADCPSAEQLEQVKRRVKRLA